MENVQNLPPHQQQELMKIMEQMQLRDGLTFYNTLVHRCFDSCVTSFRSKELDRNEHSCIENCTNRYLKSMARATTRFQEHQARKAETGSS